MAVHTNPDLLRASIAALQNGLTNIPISAAMDNTEVWQQQFLQSGIPELQNVAREIGRLQSLLTSTILDGGAIGEVLIMLGTQVSELAMSAPEDVRVDLRTLSDLLRRGGQQLTDDAQPSR